MKPLRWLLAAMLLNAQQAPDFLSTTKLVPITATVVGRNGQPVFNLKPDDFVLRDNGKQRPVQYVWRDEDLPLTIGLIVDLSGSQRQVIETQKETVLQFLRQVLRPTDQAFLVAVGRGVSLVTDLAHSVDDLRRGVDRLDPRSLFSPSDQADFDEGPVLSRSPGTLLWNGLYSALKRRMAAAEGRKVLIVMTDGIDQGSSRTLAEIVDTAQSADTVIYPIYTAPFGSGNGKGPPLVVRVAMWRTLKSARDRLQRLAQDTGGRSMDSGDMDHVKVFKTIEQELRNQYVLGFTLPEADRDGKVHQLELKAKQRGITIRARQGYAAAR